jgi:hypothetical protein
MRFLRCSLHPLISVRKQYQATCVNKKVPGYVTSRPPWAWTFSRKALYIPVDASASHTTALVITACISDCAVA